MCGIIGCVQHEGDCWNKIYEGLKRLEYRGYDSAGIAVCDGGVIRITEAIIDASSSGTVCRRYSTRDFINMDSIR